MSEAKKLWTGTWAGMPAHVEMINGSPVPFLAGRMTHFEGDVRGILGAAVVGLAAERGRENALLGETVTRLFDIEHERNALRDRLAKLENTSAAVCLVRDLLDGTGHELRKSNPTFAALDRAIDDLTSLLQPLPQGSANGETSAK